MAHAARHARPVRSSSWRPLVAAALAALLGLGVWLLVTSSEQGATPASAVAAFPPPAPVVPPGGPAPAVATPITPEERARCPVSADACVDLAGRKAWLQHDGAVTLGPVPMLPGSETGVRPPGPHSSATPTGAFHVQRKVADDFSSEFDEPMPHAVYFAPGGIAFHEGSLTKTSNGCVHLSAADAKTFYDKLKIGDGVTVF